MIEYIGLTRKRARYEIARELATSKSFKSLSPDRRTEIEKEYHEASDDYWNAFSAAGGLLVIRPAVMVIREQDIAN